ncbi:MAG TPA: type I glyceraldehyde-3-phosphate dehydrogenase [Chloroflexota bacterium]|nr:type I glyceraldehyde-3-phosphate dehydrogenase [Chloroflexota bacterium]
MATRVAINGFGRIGRQAFKVATQTPDLEVVAINELGDLDNMAYLLKYDTVFHVDPNPVSVEGQTLVVGQCRYPVVAESVPEKLPWGKMKVDVVIESTGRFASKEQAEAHIRAGARAVVVSAPASGAASFVLSVNEHEYNADAHSVISNASCTTNSVAPVMRVLNDVFGVKKALMTTVHSYTADQRLVDGPHKDWRRGRAAAMNIIPTSTGAARAATQALPALKGLFDGVSLRVPTIDVSLSDLSVLLSRRTSVEEINDAFRQAAASDRYSGILTVTDEPLVSSDFVGNPSSTIVDLTLTMVVDGDLAKVFAWYDNEWGYANRLVEETVMVGKALQGQ